MKTDYTLTPEYYQASLEAWERSHAQVCDSMDLVFEVHAVVSDYSLRHAQAMRNEYFGLLNDALDSPEPFRQRESLIRTVCKITARILFVLLLVGIALGVMI